MNMGKPRISKTEYYLDIARKATQRSTCLRRNYGAIIVNHDEIISTGYNGAARGKPNCCDVGTCYRESQNIPHGEQYEKCVAVHAEQNAIISAARRDMLGGTMYLAGFDAQTGEEIDAVPCLICERIIANSGVAKVVTRKGVIWSAEDGADETGAHGCSCGACGGCHEG